ncbi:MAG: asparaginase [Firmicutes bacterium]|nr:asparaginase [Bacillota bacterium]MBQ9605242.1 asparaginase [Bacillota bacterium]
MILLILTGGTIGSCVDANGIIDTGRSRLLELYTAIDPAQEFDVLRPIDILSENIDLKDWTKLVNAIDGANLSRYEGVIIAHGSDTLAYTSALVSMLYAHARVPFCLIAADYPLEDPKSNGMDNMSAAVNLIKSVKNGVYTVYADKHGTERVTVYPASRLIEADPYLDRFGCFGGEPFGYVENGVFTLNQKMPLSQEHFDKFNIKIKEFKNRVLFIRPYPALDYSVFDISQYAAVVHYSYHAGTADAAALSRFAAHCADMGKDIYFASLKTLDGNLYASSAALLKSGVIPLCNISPYALCAKALIAYNQDVYTPKDIMQSCLADEVLIPPLNTEVQNNL